MASCHHHGQVLICITGDEEGTLGSRSRSEDEGKKRSQQRNVAFKQQTCWCLDVRVRYTRFMLTGCCSKVPHILLCPIDALGTLEKPTIHDRGSAIWTKVFAELVIWFSHWLITTRNRESAGVMFYIQSYGGSPEIQVAMLMLIGRQLLGASLHAPPSNRFPMMVDEVSWGFLVHRLNPHSWMVMVG